MISNALMSYFIASVIAGEVVLFAVQQAAGRRRAERSRGLGWFYFTLCVGLFAMAGMSLFAYLDTLKRLRELDLMGVRYLAALDMIGTMKDLEVGQRGFLLTGRYVYLEPYRRGLSDLPTRCEKLKEAYKDSEGTLGADQACRLAQSKAKDIGAIIALREAGKKDEAMARFSSDVGLNSANLMTMMLGNILAKDRGRYNAIKAELIGIAEGRIVMAALVAAGAVVQMLLGAFWAWREAQPRPQPVTG